MQENKSTNIHDKETNAHTPLPLLPPTHHGGHVVEGGHGLLVPPYHVVAVPPDPVHPEEHVGLVLPLQGLGLVELDQRALRRLHLLHLRAETLDGRFLRDDALEHVLEELGGPDPVQRRDRVGLAQAEVPELRREERAVPVALALVHRQDHRHLLRHLPPQEGRELLVHLRRPHLPVHDQYHPRALLDRDHGLLAYLPREQGVVVVEHEPAGVHKLEVLPEEFGAPVGPVAGDPLLVGDYGAPRLSPGEAVHEGGLADVRPPDDGDERDLLGAAEPTNGRLRLILILPLQLPLPLSLARRQSPLLLVLLVFFLVVVVVVEIGE